MWMIAATRSCHPSRDGRRVTRSLLVAAVLAAGALPAGAMDNGTSWDGLTRKDLTDAGYTCNIDGICSKPGDDKKYQCSGSEDGAKCWEPGQTPLTTGGGKHKPKLGVTGGGATKLKTVP